MIKPLFAAFSFVLATTPAIASDLERNKATVDMMITMYVNSLQSNDTAIACLGVSTSKIESVITDAISACYDQYKNEPYSVFTQKLEDCTARLGDSMSQRLGVPKERFEACTSEDEDAENWQDEDYTADAVVDAEMLKLMSAASEKTLHLITLPIYPGSKVMMHTLNGMEMGGVHTLPAATFSSTDSVKTILAFYQKQLPNYTLFEDDSGSVYLMKVLPNDFNVLEHWEEYATTPHVTISPILGNSQATPGVNSKIELAYPPQ